VCGAVGSDRVAVRLSPHDNTNSFSGVTDDDPQALYNAAMAVAESHKLAYVSEKERPISPQIPNTPH